MQPKETVEVVVTREPNVGSRAPVDEPTQILLDSGARLIEIDNGNDVRISMSSAPTGAEKWPNVHHLRARLEDHAAIAAAAQIAREGPERFQIPRRLLRRILRLVTAEHRTVVVQQQAR